MIEKRWFFCLWLVLTGLSLLSGLCLLALASLPFDLLKTIGDALAKDGNLERLTFEIYQSIRFPALIAGLALSGAVLFSWLKPKSSQRMLSRLIVFCLETVQQFRVSFADLRRDMLGSLPPLDERIILLVIVLIAALFRLVFINRAMEYDEAYTFSEFARHSFKQVVTDYHVPNNHVFHTLLVRVSFLIFGNEPWAIRIPVFIAGLLLVIAVYFLGRKLYGSAAGLVAAAGTAVYPILIMYSVNARGYSLVCLFTVVLLLLADYARQHRNLAAWALMVLVTALGFYTIPIMLYPFGITIAWLFLSGLARDISPDYRGISRWLGYLVGFGVGAALLTILFYAPIFHANGIRTVFKGNTVVDPLPVEAFLAQLPQMLEHAKWEFIYGKLPDWVLGALLAGWILSIVVHFRTGNHRVPVQLAAALFLGTILLVQRPIILSRVWLFLLVLMILWTAAGLVGLAQVLRLNKRVLTIAQRVLAGGLLIALLWSGVRFITPYLKNPDLVPYPWSYDAELVTRYFQTHLEEGDVVVVSNDEDAQYWYYFEYYKIPEVHIRTIKTRPFKRAFVISHPNPRRTIPSVIASFGPDLPFFRMDTLRPVATIRNTIVYEILPNEETVKEFLGANP